MAASPAYASKSCLTMAEARQQFLTSHLYWHGAGHCWDATPPRHRVVPIKPAEDQQVRRDYRQPPSQEPNWRDAMSEMLPGDAPFEAVSAATFVAPDEPDLINWLDRWVDVAQVASPAIFSRKDDPTGVSATTARSLDLTITPVRLVLMFLGSGIMLLMIEFLFRNFIHDWRRQAIGTL